MKFPLTICLCIAALGAQPALAQSPTTGASGPATTAAAMDAVLAAGYQVKAITVLSDAATKEIFTNQQNLPSQILVTLQKGGLVAVCEMATTSWVNLTPSVMTDATRCSLR
jgi:hypothetical protein